MHSKTVFRKAGLLLMVLTQGLIAQSASPSMADHFRSEGKIYVVLAVMGIVLIFLFVFLWMLDRKINKIYKEKESKK